MANHGRVEPHYSQTRLFMESLGLKGLLSFLVVPLLPKRGLLAVCQSAISTRLQRCNGRPPRSPTAG